MELQYIKKDKHYRKVIIVLAIIALISGSILTYILLNNSDEIVQTINANTETNIIVNEPEIDKISISFAGDILMHGAERSAGYNKEENTYNFNEFFNDIKPYFEDRDCVFASLETPLMQEDNDSQYSGYPLFKAPPKLLEAIKDAGIDAVVTANNHILDQGTKGAIETMEWLEEYQIPYTGTFKSEQHKEENPALFIQKNNIKLALINYTQFTNLLGAPYAINIIDLNKIKEDIEYAKNKNADVVIVWVHFGAEYQTQPSQSDKEMINTIAENGADIIIGSHPHVIRPIEVLDIEGRKVLVSYSLGNFISNQFWRYSTDGIVLNMDIEKRQDEISIKNVTYIPTATVREYNGSEINNEKTIKTSSEDYDYITYAGSRGIIYGDKLNFRIVPIKDAISNYENKIDLKLTEKDYIRLKTSLEDTINIIGESDNYKIY